MPTVISLYIIKMLLLITLEQRKEMAYPPAPLAEATSLPDPAECLSQRFPPPAGYQRKAAGKGEMIAYLRGLPLKTKGSLVSYYDGRLKHNPGIYDAVIDLPIGHKNLHQCADAAIRLRAEYLWKMGRYGDIRFNFLSDSKPRYYLDYVKGDLSYPAFWNYLEYIFQYANTASLYEELEPVPDLKEIRAGDVFIEKKQPYGHAVIVLDVATNARGEKAVLLGQSYMPAQEIQVLSNRNNPGISPWYEIRAGDRHIYTPEWTFRKEHLKRWRK